MNFFTTPRPGGRGKLSEERRAVRDALQSMTIRKSPGVSAKVTPIGTTIKVETNLGGGGSNNVPRWG